MLRWTERAANDLVAIGDYIAADNPAAARSWVEKLRPRADLDGRRREGGCSGCVPMSVSMFIDGRLGTNADGRRTFVRAARGARG